MIGDELPDIIVESTVGSFRLHDMVDGVWSLIVPLQPFNPVSTTELGMLFKLKHEFDTRNVQVFGAVETSVEKWYDKVQELEGGTIPVIVGTFPCMLIGDIDKRIRATLQYPASTGRNFYEVLRVVDALQLAFFHQVSTPANWVYGEEVLVPARLSAVNANAIFPEKVTEFRPWFRTTPQPK